MRHNPIALLIVLAAGLAGMALLFLASGVLPPVGGKALDLDDYQDAAFHYRLAAFEDLPGWRQDALEETLAAFLLSCEKFIAAPDDAAANPVEALGPGVEPGASMAGVAQDWRGPCEAAAAVAARPYADANARTSAVRFVYEQNFQPVQILTLRAPKEGAPRGLAPIIETKGLFTGYFEPVYPASLYKTGEFSAPILLRPNDLVMVDLGRFRDELAGTRIAGRIEDGKLAPYADHGEINAGALDNIAQPLAWMRPNDLFFLQIQGSGVLLFRGGRRLRVGYDGQNGHAYTAIGRDLVARGVMALENVSMQSIRDWLDAATPEEAQRTREGNASYVFFRQLTNLPSPSLGPLGAEGVQLTAERSLAVDRRYHALGAPVWVSIVPETADETKRLQRLFIAQDTGGAIKGPVRGDIFAGSGPSAGEFAGVLRAKGEFFVLIPKTAAARLPGQERAALAQIR